MLASFLITFRETLEAALVIGIILTVLAKTRQPFYRPYVWRGLGIGVLFSVLLGVAIDMFWGGLSGKTEELFEGILMFITAGFLTWMILWVHRQKDIALKIKKRITHHIQQGYGMGIFLLVVTSVFREGTETVLYLKASSLTGATDQFTWAVIGVASALLIGYFMFTWAIKINLTKLFAITNVFLLLFASGLIAHGVHEFQEVGMLPIFPFDPIINVSHILDHKSLVGSFLRVLFGYTSKPTVLELLSYGSYIVFILWFEKVTSRTIRSGVT